MITRAQIESDYLSVKEIALEFRAHPDTVRRWIRKDYADRSKVETMGGTYYVHKEEVQRWRSAFGDRDTVLRGAVIPFK